MKIINPITNPNPWLRGLYMILFTIIYKLIEMAIFLIVIFQFGHSILLSRSQQKLVSLGKKLSDYNYHIYMFLTFNTEQRPYPFEDE